MTLRWGVLGARSRNHRMRLRPAFALANQRIVAEGSRNGDDLSGYDEVVADPHVDAVYITLPNSLHVQWVRKALEAGKHVLCEKPLAMSGPDTEALFAAASAAGRHLSEAYMWPHHPRAVRLVEVVAAGELGPLIAHSATFTYQLDRPGDHRVDQRGGGVLLDGGIYCLGPALCVRGGESGVGAAAARGEGSGQAGRARRGSPRGATPSGGRSAPDGGRRTSDGGRSDGSAPVGVVAAAQRNDLGVDVAMSGWVDLGGGAGASFVVALDAPPRRHQAVTGRDGVVVVENHFPGPERPGVLSILRRDGTRDEVDHAGANAYERMLSAFVAEAAGDTAPRWPATHAIHLAHLFDRLHAASGRPT